MKINLHKNAGTTPAQRAFIQENISISNTDLAQRLGVSTTTVRRWKKRDNILDKSCIPKKTYNTLTREQEIVIICLRIFLRLSLDDLLGITRSCINPQCSRSVLNRCLKKHGISRFKKTVSRTEYDPFVFFPDRGREHLGTSIFLNVIQLSGFLNFFKCQFLFIVVDLQTHWLNIEIANNPTQDEIASCLNTLIKTHPINVRDLLTLDKIVYVGSPGRLDEKKNIYKTRMLRSICNSHGINYHACGNHHTDIIANFEKTDIKRGIKTLLETYLTFTDFKKCLENFVNKYNTENQQRSLKQITPLGKMGSHYKKFPGSFNFRPNQGFGT